MLGERSLKCDCLTRIGSFTYLMLQQVQLVVRQSLRCLRQELLLRIGIFIDLRRLLNYQIKLLIVFLLDLTFKKLLLLLKWNDRFFDRWGCSLTLTENDNCLTHRLGQVALLLKRLTTGTLVYEYLLLLLLLLRYKLATSLEWSTWLEINSIYGVVGVGWVSIGVWRLSESCRILLSLENALLLIHWEDWRRCYELWMAQGRLSFWQGLDLFYSLVAFGWHSGQ